MIWLWIGIGALLAWGMVALKSAVVLGLMRNAVGADVPPRALILVIAGVLSLVVLAPVIAQIQTGTPELQDAVIPPASTPTREGAEQMAEPLRAFLERNCEPALIARFAALPTQTKPGQQVPPEAALSTSPARLEVLAPAFIASELQKAFQIGFLLILPFIVIDLLMGVVLVGGGLGGLPPQAIGLPLKLIVFIGADGWSLLIEALISGYR